MGKWIHLDTSYKSYVNPESLHCQACGKMIPKDAWISEKEGTDVSFCDQECEKMYDYMAIRRTKK
jgi:predicted nucleic acid-binding Zn ribbon protein